MGNIIDIIISAIPWISGVISTADVLVSAIPSFLSGLVSQADVLVSAIPWSGAVTSFLVLLLVSSWIFFKEEFKW